MSNAKTTAFLGRKGGVGKTTCCVGVAAVLVAQGRRVLVVDMDPQSNVAHAFGVDPSARGTPELLLGRLLGSAIPDPVHVFDRLAVYPANGDLLCRTIQQAHPDELATALRSAGALEAWDHILIDCPPGEDHLELLAVSASTAAFVILDAHQFALRGAQRVLALLDQHKSLGRAGPRAWGVVMNKTDLRRQTDRHWTDEVRETWAHLPLFELRQDALIARATNSSHAVTAKPYRNARGVSDLTAIARWADGQA